MHTISIILAWNAFQLTDLTCEKFISGISCLLDECEIISCVVYTQLCGIQCVTLFDNCSGSYIKNCSTKLIETTVHTLQHEEKNVNKN